MSGGSTNGNDVDVGTSFYKIQTIHSRNMRIIVNQQLLQWFNRVE